MDDLIERLHRELKAADLHCEDAATVSVALLREAAAALEAAREDAWQPIETCPNAGRVVMFCDERQNIWTDCAWDRSAAATGFYATHWRPLPAPPAIDAAREARNG